MDSNTEPLNNWAKIKSQVESGDIFFIQDQLSFYFFWQNDTGTDAVVNVTSYLMVNGWCEVSANSGWIWSPFWGQGTIGNSTVSINTELSLLEWWNQPPTQPVRQSGQVQDILTLSVSGGFALVSPGKTGYKYFSDNAHVNYDGFQVPHDAVAVFEVALNLAYSGYSGVAKTDFEFDDSLVLCSYLQLEVVGPFAGLEGSRIINPQSALPLVA